MTELTDTPKILLVDDRQEKLFALVKLLEALPVETVLAHSGSEAIKQLAQHDMALILMGVQMPEMDGFEAAERIRNNQQTNHIPIIFLTARGTEYKDISRGYQAGALDYLFTPIEPFILLAKVKVYVELYQQQAKLRTANILIQEQNDLLKYQATRDGLTGLYNHKQFQKLFGHDFNLTKRHNRDLSLMMFDLDYFKDINDTYGHQAGDAVLREFAALLAAQVRETDILARYGGEEFILALPHTDLPGALTVADKIRELAEEHRYLYKDERLQVTVSIGVSEFFPIMEHPTELIEQADNALYQAKGRGRNCVVPFDPSDEDTTGGGDDCLLSSEFVCERLKVNLSKTRSATLASFEALVHSQFRDYYSIKERQQEVVQLVDLMGQRLNFPESVMQSFHRAFKLHDLLRLYIADSSLNNGGTLDEAEKMVIQDQPLMLKELTDLFDFFSNERVILQHHHEYYDGTGYPDGLAGDEVPMGSRLFALVDAAVAMNRNRTPDGYRKNRQEIVQEFTEQAGKQFDPYLVKILLDLIEEHNLFSDAKGAGDGH